MLDLNLQNFDHNFEHLAQNVWNFSQKCRKFGQNSQRLKAQNVSQNLAHYKIEFFFEMSKFCQHLELYNMCVQMLFEIWSKS